MNFYLQGQILEDKKLTICIDSYRLHLKKKIACFRGILQSSVKMFQFKKCREIRKNLDIMGHFKWGRHNSLQFVKPLTNIKSRR